MNTRRILKVWGDSGLRCLVASVLLVCSALASGEPRNSWLAPLENTWKLQAANQNYSITRVQSPTRHGNESLRFEVRKGDVWKSWSSRTSHRAEISTKALGRRNTNNCYGFSILLPKEFPIEKTRLVLAQWLSRAAPHPSLAIRFRDGRLYITVQTDLSIKGSNARTGAPYAIFSTNDFKLDVWHDFIVEVYWSASNSGRVRIWWNGRQVANYSGPNMYRLETPTTFKYGIYRDDSERTFIAYFNEVRTGVSRSEVDPSRLRN